MKTKLISLLVAVVLLVSTLASCAFDFKKDSGKTVTLDLSGLSGTIAADQVRTYTAEEFAKLVKELANTNAKRKDIRESGETIGETDVLSLSVDVTQSIGLYTTPVIATVTVTVEKGEITSCTVASEAGQAIADIDPVKNVVCDYIRAKLETTETDDDVKVGDTFTLSRDDVYVSGTGSAKSVKRYDGTTKWSYDEILEGNVDANGDLIPDTQKREHFVSSTMQGVTTNLEVTVLSAAREDIEIGEDDIISVYYYYGDHKEHDFGITTLGSDALKNNQKPATVFNSLSTAHNAVEAALLQHLRTAGIGKNAPMTFTTGKADVTADNRDYVGVSVVATYETTDGTTTTPHKVTDLSAVRSFFLGKDEATDGFDGIWSWKGVQDEILRLGSIEVDKEYTLATATLFINTDGSATALKKVGESYVKYTADDAAANEKIVEQEVKLTFTVTEHLDTGVWQTATCEGETVHFFVSDVKSPVYPTFELLQNDKYANSVKYDVTSSASAAKDGKEEITNKFLVTEQHEHTKDGEESGYTLLVNSALGAVICKYKTVTENDVETRQYFKYDAENPEAAEPLTFEDLFTEELEAKKDVFPAHTGTVDTDSEFVDYAMLYYLLVNEETSRMKKGTAAIWNAIMDKTSVKVPTKLLDAYYDELYENARYEYYTQYLTKKPEERMIPLFRVDKKPVENGNTVDVNSYYTFKSFETYFAYYVLKNSEEYEGYIAPEKGKDSATILNENAALAEKGEKPKKTVDQLIEAAVGTQEVYNDSTVHAGTIPSSVKPVEAISETSLRAKIDLMARKDLKARLVVHALAEELDIKIDEKEYKERAEYMYYASYAYTQFPDVESFVKAAYGSVEGAKTAMLFDTILEHLYKEKRVGETTFTLTFDAKE